MTDSEKLLALFKSTKIPLTAKKIAAKTDTYAATAKRRVEALIAAGHKIKAVRHREGKRGPASAAWVLT
jgi:hypothetical protein